MAPTSCTCQTAPAACAFHDLQAGEKDKDREGDRERERVAVNIRQALTSCDVLLSLQSGANIP